MNGHVSPGFEPVRKAFEEVAAETTGGVAFSVVRRGETLVDLWSGWTVDTLVVLFSGTKGLVATVLAILTDRGLLDPDERVAGYWPEFAAAGKEDVRVSHVLSHTVGLPYVEQETPLLDNTANAAALATQRPLWTPGTQVAYHALTYGYLATELARRVTGQSMGTLIRTLLTEPYGLDVHLGGVPDERVMPVVRAPGYRISTFLQDEDRRAIVDRMYRGMLDSTDVVNSPEYRHGELAAGGALGTARGMAHCYDLLTNGRIVAPETLKRATRTWSEGLDAVNDRPVRFGLGFELADPIGTYGPAEVAFGHSGAGGGRHGAWPEAGVGFSFTTSEMVAEDVDFRASSLLTALASVLF